MGTSGAAGNGQLGNWLAPYQLYAVYIFKSIALATALMVGISTLADAAARQRSPSFSASGAYRAYPQYPTTAPLTAGDGYSADPHTRYLEMLADKYRPGW